MENKITFYWNKKIDEEYHINMWTNRICTEKLLKEDINKQIHIFFIPVPYNNDDVFDYINPLIGKNYKLIVWFLDHSTFDDYYDGRILQLYQMGEDIIKITPDMNIKNDYPFKILNNYSMADTVLEQQQNDRKLIMGLFKKSEKWGRLKHFLSFNGTPKPHRINYVNKLYENNLLDYFNISFLSWFTVENNRFNLTVIEEEMLHVYDSVLLPKEMLPMHLDFGNEFGTSSLNLPLYFNSYIDVVTMAKYDNKGVYLDEKVYKSFACLKPFIIVGQYETLKTLKSYGFKTFSPIINEDYDSERDSEKRMDMVIQEIKKFSEMSISEMDRIFWQFKDILVHNFLHLKKYINDIDDTLIKEICK
jgi:hypothetical protein